MSADGATSDAVSGELVEDVSGIEIGVDLHIGALS